MITSVIKLEHYNEKFLFETKVTFLSIQLAKSKASCPTIVPLYFTQNNPTFYISISKSTSTSFRGYCKFTNALGNSLRTLL